MDEIYLWSLPSRWRDGGERGDECAILYRVSAQSRAFEEALLSAGVPYRVYGGMRFYERAEIKDALLPAPRYEPNDDAAFERVVNVPPRGIGARSVDIIRARARDDASAMWLRAVLCDRWFHDVESRNAVRGFIDLIDHRG